MSKILGVVFSKDRAAQLDLFLRTANEKCPGVFKFVVLYTHSNYNHENGYKIVQRKNSNNVYGENVTFVKEKHFATDVMEILRPELPDFEPLSVHGISFPRNEHKSRCVAFFTDDCVMYKAFKLNDKELADFLTVNDITSLSLRLGENIKWQNHWEPLQPVLPVNKTEKNMGDEKMVVWHVADSVLEQDYGRPISMDGNVHILEDFVKLLDSHAWNCVRTIDAIQPRGPKIKMCSFENSVLVNVPLNLTYGGHADNYAKRFKWNQDDLNSWFLQGNALELPFYAESSVNSSHKEYDLRPLHLLNEPESLTLNEGKVWKDIKYPIDLSEPRPKEIFVEAKTQEEADKIKGLQSFTKKMNDEAWDQLLKGIEGVGENEDSIQDDSASEEPTSDG